MEPSVKGLEWLKIFTYGHSPLIKMTAMPIYGKRSQLIQNLVGSIGAASRSKIAKIG